MTKEQAERRKELMHMVGQVVAGGGYIDAFDVVYKCRKIIAEVDAQLASEGEPEPGVNLPVEAGK
jgi:hypothetical protein